jgi:hypothetical protein
VGTSLKRGLTKSCGCLRKEKSKTQGILSTKDLTGQRFGRLIVIDGIEKKSINGNYFWKCQCDCGNTSNIRGSSLSYGSTKSCGCLQKEKAISSNSGENSHMWRGGTSNLSYPPIWNDELKEYIRNRDNHKCQYLDCRYDDIKEKRKLHVHHIDGNKTNCFEYNLISLCDSHHHIVESNNPKLYMEQFYQYTNSFLLKEK